MKRNFLQAKKYLIVLIFNINACYAENVLLQTPQKVSAEDIDRITANQSVVCALPSRTETIAYEMVLEFLHRPGNSKLGFQLTFSGENLIKELTKQENALFSNKGG
ncbi:hypothetical protein [Wolbachia endosymbiont of Wuchereria bancrofti]|uniref:hypothetical protein n=1 Tax=Wolbachia endosymbiont of Wuchereria bancrofti TaxID=96496 RepID=UPI0003449F2D|nr:hypothetical protein [Wolbachia endosymbiont of Wuchereria bancrofti]OWZ24944.1 hypothetical protein CCY16_00417 [Wolbachia endosymbiont of Wuchereria bancrofti]